MTNKRTYEELEQHLLHVGNERREARGLLNGNAFSLALRELDELKTGLSAMRGHGKEMWIGDIDRLAEKAKRAQQLFMKEAEARSKAVACLEP